MPLRFEAAILSRMRSPVTSLSNWAKESRTLSVRRPIEVVVLNCWVTATKETPWASKISTILAKSARERVTVDLVGHHNIYMSRADVGEQTPQRRPLGCRARKPAV